MQPEEHNQPDSLLAPEAQPEQPKNVARVSRPRKKLVVACVLSVVATLLLASGGMAGAYLVGRQSSDQNLAQRRETIVQEGEVIADVAQKVGQSVVSIVTEQKATGTSYFSDGGATSKAAGTGLIIDSNGYILTNKHVVPDGTSTVQVITSDGTSYNDVQIVGRDPLNDIAILKVPSPKGFVAATLGDSGTVRTGQKVIAIGNALGQFQNTVTSGIISGMGRPVEAGDELGSASEQLTNLFQTDAAINAGNSGGPLLNYNGEVIGINTAIAADAQNIGFSIPINEAKGIIASVKSTGKVSRPYIGVKYTSLTADIAKQLNLSVTKGAYVGTDAGSVLGGSPAAKAGIQAGDVIIKVNDKALDDQNSLSSVVGQYKVGDTVTLTIVRGGKNQAVKVTLAEAPTS
jgi:serine protease Do